MSEPSTSPVPTYAWVILACIAILDIVTGSIHFFAPDGGAGTIAHFDLVPGAQATTEIIYLFALLGTTQYAFSIFNLYAALKKRELVPLAFILVAFLNGMGIITNLFFKAPPDQFPFQYRTIIVFALSAIVLILLYKERKNG